MIAGNWTVATHPDFFRYVMIEMPKVMNVPVIVRAMAAHGFLGTHAFRTALTRGNPPHLHLVMNLHNTVGRWGHTPENPPVPLHGWTPPPNSILLDRSLGDGFGSRVGPLIVNTATGGNVFRAGVTILHELCHWGDWQAHGQFTDVLPQDHGDDFEADVYGGHM